ncbi:MAG: sulfotransferase [Bacteroidota bacterium]
MKRRIITLSGMHRSGTSLVMSWLEQTGLSLFDKVGPNVGNRFGHFEDIQFCRLQGLAIKDRMPHSKGWIIDNKQALNFTPEEQQKALALIDKRNKASDLWGWKDPRTTVFLAEWKKLIPDLKVIALYRPHQEVLHSLLKRASKSPAPMLQIDQAQALDNWLYYNDLLLEYKAQYPADCILLPLYEVLNNNRATFEYLVDKFDLDLHYVDIHQLYDPVHLSKRENYLLSNQHQVLCSAMEQRLEENSDQLN